MRETLQDVIYIRTGNGGVEKVQLVIILGMGMEMGMGLIHLRMTGWSRGEHQE